MTPTYGYIVIMSLGYALSVFPTNIIHVISRLAISTNHYHIHTLTALAVIIMLEQELEQMGTMNDTTKREL